MSQDKVNSNSSASIENQVVTDQVLTYVEPSIDIAAHALKYSRQEVVKTQIQLVQVKRVKNLLIEREKVLLQEAQRWTLRAEAMAAESEQKELDCLAHRVLCRVRLTRVRESLLAHQALESKLDAKFRICKFRLESLAVHGTQSDEQRNAESALESIERESSTLPGKAE